MSSPNLSSSILIKNCGLRSAKDITAAAQSGADYVGFVHYPSSPRHIAPEKVGKILANTGVFNHPVETVAVTVNAKDNVLQDIFSHYSPNYIQLHGDESPERCTEIKAHYKTSIIKAIAVEHAEDIGRWQAFRNAADWILFDAKTPKNALPGGMGMSFNWSLLQNLDISLPWMLSGGLNIDNVNDAMRITNAKAVDVSSGIELRAGEKDANKIREFNTCVKNYDH